MRFRTADPSCLAALAASKAMTRAVLAKAKPNIAAHALARHNRRRRLA